MKQRNKRRELKDRLKGYKRRQGGGKRVEEVVKVERRIKEE